MIMILSRIKKKLKKSGFKGLFASSLRRLAGHLDGSSTIYPSHQTTAHSVLSRYTSFDGKDVLEIGGNQSCESAYPFLADGANSVVVSGLDQISYEQVNKEQNIRILRADALSLSKFFEPCSFDVIYGLSIVEHIISPKVFLNEVYKVLKPGGIAYFEGDPIWSSPKGHHLWVATWGGAYQYKSTANYLFDESPSRKSTNPLPDWSHLLMTQEQMREHLLAESLPNSDIECIIDWVYHSEQVNRLNMTEIADAYTNSELIVLEANTSRFDVPPDIELALRKKCGDGIDYGISSVSYVLAKR